MNNLLKRICDTPGVSGFEDRIRSLVSEEIRPLVDSLRVDRMGNLIGCKSATKKPGQRKPLKVMLSAHMDEIGFMVKHIDAEGFVRFVPIGGFEPRTLVGQYVAIHGSVASDGEVHGAIAPQPNWILSDEEKRRVLPIEELYIDTGMPAAWVNERVRIGDPITLGQEFRELTEEIYAGRNFDNRLCVYILIETMRRLKDTAVDVYAVASVQEEVGVRGATTAAYAIDPDIGIGLDESLASDVPYAKPQDRHCELGKGAGIYIMDNRTISDPRLIELLTRVGDERKIAYQRNIGGGTDASVIQRTKEGSIACTIGPPARYMHSTAQLAHRDDIENCIRLLVSFLEVAHTAEFAYPENGTSSARPE